LTKLTVKLLCLIIIGMLVLPLSALGAGLGTSVSGTPIIGEWEVTGESSATSSLGGGWNQIFKGDVGLADYTVKADVQWVETGTAAQFPKYGIFAAYKDGDNFVTAFIDKNFKVLATFGKVAGADQPWENAALPENFDFAKFHEIKVVKTGSEFKFFVDGTLLMTRTFDISSGQYGLITEDTKASYTNVSVVTPQAAADTADAKETAPAAENKLPDTATNTYNMLMVGAVLVLLGTAAFVFVNRKSRA
jgi:LPXTG-motif cell wall-anchored protein